MSLWWSDFLTPEHSRTRPPPNRRYRASSCGRLRNTPRHRSVAISAGANPVAPNRKQQTALTLALPNADRFAVFVEPGTDLSSLAALPGKPAVLIAAERNDLAAVVALLAAGCPANKAFRGKTALDTARKHDNAAMVTALSAAT